MGSLPRMKRLGAFLTGPETVEFRVWAPNARAIAVRRYDGVYAFAPHAAYGGPEGLARLVDAAHREDLAVFLDVVYNHIGPGSEAIAAFGPYFGATTEWGPALDYAQRGVREWAVQNAELWTRDYKLDGLRLDAVAWVRDDSKPHVLAELKQRVGDAIVVSE